MRSSRLLTLAASAALLAACGDSSGPSNASPTAAFNPPSCTLLACDFAGTGTDSDGSIASYAWNFGDASSGSNTAATQNASHTFSAAGTYTVTLTVTDNGGATNSANRQVTVSDIPNTPPTADFSFDCTNLVCAFTDLSADADGSIATRSWDFGDGQQGTGAAPMHTYAAAGTYNVTVSATDNGGASTTSAAQAVTVTASSAGNASFTASCTGLDCTLTNTSTPSGSVVTYAWNFGDGQTSTAQNPPPVHYTATSPTTFTITLVVTSDGATSQATRQVRVTPAATLTCNGIDCTLGLDQASTVLVTLVSSDCQVRNNKFVITAPAVDTLFTDGCFDPVGSSFPLNNGAAYAAGTQLAAEVLSGVAGATSPQLRVTGNFADGWTIEFDDGFVGPGEPDFNDLVITVKATPAP